MNPTHVDCLVHSSCTKTTCFDVKRNKLFPIGIFHAQRIEFAKVAGEYEPPRIIAGKPMHESVRSWLKKRYIEGF